MSKKIKGIITVLILSIILVMHISYAITNEKKSEFFTVNKSEISPEETLEMTIDISKIQYKKFTFKLDTNVEVKEIYAKENTDVNIDNKSNDVNIDIDKSTINLDKITLYYVIPKDTTIGTKIQLTAQILAEEENESNNNANKIEKENIVNIDNTANVTNTAVQNNTEMKDSETKAEEKVVEKVKLEILVVEKKDDNKQENENNNEDKKETQEQDGKQGNKSDLGNSQDQTKNTAQNAKTTSNANVKVTSSANSSNQVVETETAVYEGSRNNYLSNLEIEGVTFNTNFRKDNMTYFAEVENQSSVNVSVTKEDETATVCITGNDSLKSGENKILISVTAENGDVRYYRIFIENK